MVIANLCLDAVSAIQSIIETTNIFFKFKSEKLRKVDPFEKD